MHKERKRVEYERLNNPKREVNITNQEQLEDMVMLNTIAAVIRTKKVTAKENIYNLDK